MVSARPDSIPMPSANAEGLGAYCASALSARSPSFFGVSLLKRCEPPYTVWTGCRVPDSGARLREGLVFGRSRFATCSPRGELTSEQAHRARGAIPGTVSEAG